ncbi:MAG: hypothetical protein EBU31_18380, partial [Proteobacteria bacterium]|nr:hypothetical protein [Pseudomonadota bacterium]
MARPVSSGGAPAGHGYTAPHDFRRRHARRCAACLASPQDLDGRPPGRSGRCEGLGLRPRPALRRR